MGLDFGAGAALFHRLQHRRVFAAVAVEQRDGFARRQPHHVHVVRHGFRQVDDEADGERLRAVETGHAGALVSAVGCVILMAGPPVW
ncbi:hypothetical protein D3C86_2015640 [compost metagenome]